MLAMLVKTSHDVHPYVLGPNTLLEMLRKLEGYRLRSALKLIVISKHSVPWWKKRLELMNNGRWLVTRT